MKRILVVAILMILGVSGCFRDAKSQNKRIPVNVITGLDSFQIGGRYMQLGDLSDSTKFDSVKYVSPKFTQNVNPFFATITAALNNAGSGTLIIVYPGTYTEGITGKNFVAIHCFDGVTVTRTRALTSTPLISNGAGVFFAITGAGTFIDSGEVIQSSFSLNGNIVFEAKSVVVNDSASFLMNGNVIGNIKSFSSLQRDNPDNARALLRSAGGISNVLIDSFYCNPLRDIGIQVSSGFQQIRVNKSINRVIECTGGRQYITAHLIDSVIKISSSGVIQGVQANRIEDDMRCEAGIQIINGLQINGGAYINSSGQEQYIYTSYLNGVVNSSAGTVYVDAEKGIGGAITNTANQIIKTGTLFSTVLNTSGNQTIVANNFKNLVTCGGGNQNITSYDSITTNSTASVTTIICSGGIQTINGNVIAQIHPIVSHAAAPITLSGGIMYLSANVITGYATVINITGGTLYANKINYLKNLNDSGHCIRQAGGTSYINAIDVSGSFQPSGQGSYSTFNIISGYCNLHIQDSLIALGNAYSCIEVTGTGGLDVFANVIIADSGYACLLQGTGGGTVTANNIINKATDSGTVIDVNSASGTWTVKNAKITGRGTAIAGETFIVSLTTDNAIFWNCVFVNSDFLSGLDAYTFYSASNRDIRIYGIANGNVAIDNGVVIVTPVVGSFAVDAQVQ